MLLIDRDDGAAYIIEYSLTTPFDISTANNLFQGESQKELLKQ